jgi:hypothetical protein
VAISHEICQKNRIIGSVIIRPISKISPIWGYFETELDTGFFWGVKRVIGGHFGPGLERVHTKPVRRRGGEGIPFPPLPAQNTNKDFPAFPENAGHVY